MRSLPILQAPVLRGRDRQRAKNVVMYRRSSPPDDPKIRLIAAKNRVGGPSSFSIQQRIKAPPHEMNVLRPYSLCSALSSVP